MITSSASSKYFDLVRMQTGARLVENQERSFVLVRESTRELQALGFTAR